MTHRPTPEQALEGLIGRIDAVPAGGLAPDSVPTGFPSLPPTGPATPVTETPSAVLKRCRAPSAMAMATALETAPCSSSMAAGTPSSTSLARFE